MPISLLLHELTTKRLRFLPVFDQWSQWLALEETVLARARAAFLVHWFGLGFPTEGLAVAGYVDNIDELRDQYLWARRRMPGLNIFEPLAAWAGGTVGSILGLFLGLVSIFVPMSFATLGLIAAVIVGVGGAAATLTFTNTGLFQGIYRVSGGLTEVISNLLEIWRWLTGPRDAIRNPLIHTALDILDRIPLITSHLVAFVAILLARVVPYIGRLASQIPLLFNLIRESVAVIRWVLDDVKARFFELADGPRSAFGLLKFSLALLKSLPKVFKSGLMGIFKQVTSGLTNVVNALSAALGPWLHEISDTLRERIVDPISAFIDAAALVFRRIKDILPPSKPKPSTPSSLPNPLPDTSAVRALIRPAVGEEPALGPGMIGDLARELRDLRAQGVVPDLDAFFRGELSVNASGELATPFSRLSELGREIAGMDLGLPSVFAGEARALTQLAGGPPAAVLNQLRERDEHYRDLISSIMDRVMPASAAGYWEMLAPLLEKLDEKLFERPAHERRIVYPVLDLRDEDRLRLEIGAFRLRYRGPDPDREGTPTRGRRVPVSSELRERVRALGADVRIALIGQAYHRPAQT